MTPQEDVERALELSKTDGCIVIADEASEANLRWADNSLTTNGVTRRTELTVVAFHDTAAGRCAGAQTAQVSTPADVEDLVRAAELAAVEGAPARDAAPLLDGALGTDWTAPPAVTSIEVFHDLVPALDELLTAAAGAGQHLYGFAQHELTSTFVGSSTGLRGRWDQPGGRLEINARGADPADSTWTGTFTEDFTDVDPAGMVAELDQRSAWGRRKRTLPPGRYETLLMPAATADLMAYLFWRAAGLDAHEGRTAFSRPGGGTRVGDRLAELPVRLWSDPAAAGISLAPYLVARVPGRTSVFDTGAPLVTTDWIAEGSLTALPHSRYSAQLADASFTPAIANLLMSGAVEPAPRPLADMIADTRHGLLVNCLWYIRQVDAQRLLVTGLTRDGVYLVENGEVTGQVHDFRFNDSPVEMLSRLVEIGAPETALPRMFAEYLPRTVMPALRVADFTMSSVSRAS
jgi:predicted Zn-dependent protease